MKRRRFLCLSASFAAMAGAVRAETWRGHALGAEAQVTLSGPRDAVARAFSVIPARLREVERLFSLYDPGSALVRLNAEGRATGLDPLFTALLEACDRAHDLTEGVFDPTVQPVWAALSAGRPPEPAFARVGWGHVARTPGGIVLGPGQALTFNGIAQGFATDLLASDLAALGFTERALVQVGEFAALGGPFRIGIVDPAAGFVGHRTLRGRALATSSPDSTRVGTASHLIHPGQDAPRWSTVSVEAETACLADALSTAAVFLPEAALERLAKAAAVDILAVDHQGDLRRWDGSVNTRNRI